MFEAISRRFQLKFKDRTAAGNILGEILKDRLKEERLEQDIIVVVLGIPRGGVVTADAMVRKLTSLSSSTSSLQSSSSANTTTAVYFDIIIPRKLTAPDNKELAIGAIMEDGTTYLDQEMVSMLQITPEYLEKEKANQIEEIKRRTALYSTDILINNNYHHREYLKGKFIILVDDGAAIGATLIAAARWLRKHYSPSRLIIAVPVAPKDTVKLLKQEADVVEVVTSPFNFRSVGQFYQDFQQVSDDKVIEILRNRNTH
jgi:predicted phosphoribosyltransferase